MNRLIGRTTPGSEAMVQARRHLRGVVQALDGVLPAQADRAESPTPQPKRARPRARQSKKKAK